MVNPLEYIRNRPKLAKQMIGLSLPQLEKLIKQAIARDHQLKREAEREKIRVNQKGAGRPRSLSQEEEIYLSLFYLRQMPIFEVLGMMFEVSRTTANALFHYWLPILRDLLPSSLLEEWENSIQDNEFVKKLLTSYQLLVDSSEQCRERPQDQEEQEKYYSGKQNRHTFKNQFITLPQGEDIVDVIVGERGPEADINLWRRQQLNFSDEQTFKGDLGYQGAERTKTPHKKPPKKKLTPEKKAENQQLAKERIYVEHLIRIVKIFRLASERFRLHSSTYQQVMLVICGLVRLRIGAFQFSF
jgi:hypothetical protein